MLHSLAAFQIGSGACTETVLPRVVRPQPVECNGAGWVLNNTHFSGFGRPIMTKTKFKTNAFSLAAAHEAYEVSCLVNGRR